MLFDLCITICAALSGARTFSDLLAHEFVAGLTGAHPRFTGVRWIEPQSPQVPVGPTMSPKISPVPAMHPSRLLVPGCFGDAGIISATGWPKRVISIGSPVFRACSRIRRQLALNSAIGISFISNRTMVDESGQPRFIEWNSAQFL